ncbi:MAG: hypothetical protein KGD70_15625 [Candidatus Lokiarchaeota archaeon]|nr:hypothetical protein [Candidatus Lokiarchaeota archaeon]MCJ7714558.1 hypothetical protein [Candidatus Bathyarchaeota archaeon]
MTISDELLYEIIKPKSNGETGDDAPIIDIVGKKKIAYKIEKSTAYTQKLGTGKNIELDIVKITPDILVKINSENSNVETNGGLAQNPEQYIALEIENDVQWDFKKSLRQLKKIKCRFPDTRVLIPKEYERFAPFYVNEGIRVYIWDAKRIWKCMKCGTDTEKRGLITPMCSKPKCKNHKQNEFRLSGLNETIIDEFK